MVLISESPTINSSFPESIQEDKVSTPFSHQQPLKLIGSITHLMLSSPLHRKYKIAHIAERFVPSLIHNQFRYYEIDGNPIGFVNWAWLTDEVEQKFLTEKYVLQLDEWQGGNNLCFPEFIAPFGHARLIITDLRTNIFPKGTPAKSLKINPDGTLKSIYRWTA
ncbi:toxin-activating lysine-acyltransferase [Nostoc sp. FACHB-190]|uniref:toxin-activating lysine-acyltransferase n=1 Tax=Nostoc sp. FACHB-190 TaxID=2692838 RepID=UPI001685052E|nr:toxin-activating lysine-acyltransferase [Nostoc sp. FACHB-190]MBD2302097.1 toxin-activating lysine-acyltransferase [Nostoc sp. FACHB-190]